MNNKKYTLRKYRKKRTTKKAGMILPRSSHVNIRQPTNVSTNLPTNLPPIFNPNIDSHNDRFATISNKQSQPVNPSFNNLEDLIKQITLSMKNISNQRKDNNSKINHIKNSLNNDNKQINKITDKIKCCLEDLKKQIMSIQQIYNKNT